MSNKLRPLIVSLATGILIISIILTLIALGPTNIVPWLLVVAILLIQLYCYMSDKKHFVTWKDQYSVGITEIDNDHKKLLNLINHLQAAVIYKTGEQFEQESLDEIIAYTKYHFNKEEQMMEEAHYDDLEAHKLQHKQMIDEINNFLKNYKLDRHGTLIKLTSYLKDWLINHINGTDQKYREVVRNHLSTGEQVKST